MRICTEIFLKLMSKTKLFYQNLLLLSQKALTSNFFSTLSKGIIHLCVSGGLGRSNSSLRLPVSVITKEHHHRPVQVAVGEKLSEKLRVKLVHYPGQWRIKVTSGNYHMVQKLGLATQRFHKTPAEVQVQVGERLRIEAGLALMRLVAPRQHLAPKVVVVDVDGFSGEAIGKSVKQTQQLMVFVKASDVVAARKLAPNQWQVVALRVPCTSKLRRHVIGFSLGSQTSQQWYQVWIAVFADLCELYRVVCTAYNARFM